MKRPSYSLYFVPSVLHGREMLVGDQLTSMLIAWAETTPRVKTFTVGAPAFVYDDEQGKTKETKVSLSVGMLDGAVAYWDGCRADQQEKQAKPLAVKASHARLAGARHHVFSDGILDPASIERRNRVAAHQLLYLGRNRDTDELETRLLMRLASGPVSLSSFASHHAVSHEVATLAVMRAFLKGRVHVPLQSQPLGPNWELQGAYS